MTAVKWLRIQAISLFAISSLSLYAEGKNYNDESINMMFGYSGGRLQYETESAMFKPAYAQSSIPPGFAPSLWNLPKQRMRDIYLAYTAAHPEKYDLFKHKFHWRSEITPFGRHFRPVIGLSYGKIKKVCYSGCKERLIGALYMLQNNLLSLKKDANTNAWESSINLFFWYLTDIELKERQRMLSGYTAIDVGFSLHLQPEKIIDPYVTLGVGAGFGGNLKRRFGAGYGGPGTKYFQRIGARYHLPDFFIYTEWEYQIVKYRASESDFEPDLTIHHNLFSFGIGVSGIGE